MFFAPPPTFPFRGRSSSPFAAPRGLTGRPRSPLPPPSPYEEHAAGERPFWPNTAVNTYYRAPLGKRHGKINWRMIYAIDLERVIHEGDVETLVAQLENLMYANFDVDDLQACSDVQYVKLFQLAQLALEYLYGTVRQLEDHTMQLTDGYHALKAHHDETYATLQDEQERIRELKKDLKQRKKALAVYEMLAQNQQETMGTCDVADDGEATEAKTGAGVRTAVLVKCGRCAKKFLNSMYLDSHIQKRHAGETMPTGAGEDFATLKEEIQRGLRDTHRMLQSDLTNLRHEMQDLHDRTTTAGGGRTVQSQPDRDMEAKLQSLIAKHEQQSKDLLAKMQTIESQVVHQTAKTAERVKADISQPVGQLESRLQQVEGLLQTMQTMRKTQGGWLNDTRTNDDSKYDVEAVLNEVRQLREDVKVGAAFGSPASREMDRDKELDKTLDANAKLKETLKKLNRDKDEEGRRREALERQVKDLNSANATLRNQLNECQRLHPGQRPRESTPPTVGQPDIGVASDVSAPAPSPQSNRIQAAIHTITASAHRDFLRRSEGFISHPKPSPEQAEAHLNLAPGSLSNQLANLMTLRASAKERAPPATIVLPTVQEEPPHPKTQEQQQLTRPLLESLPPSPPMVPAPPPTCPLPTKEIEKPAFVEPAPTPTPAPPPPAPLPERSRSMQNVREPVHAVKQPSTPPPEPRRQMVKEAPPPARRGTGTWITLRNSSDSLDPYHGGGGDQKVSVVQRGAQLHREAHHLSDGGYHVMHKMSSGSGSQADGAGLTTQSGSATASDDADSTGRRGKSAPPAADGSSRRNSFQKLREGVKSVIRFATPKKRQSTTNTSSKQPQPSVQHHSSFNHHHHHQHHQQHHPPPPVSHSVVNSPERPQEPLYTQLSAMTGRHSMSGPVAQCIEKEVRAALYRDQPTTEEDVSGQPVPEPQVGSSVGVGGRGGPVGVDEDPSEGRDTERSRGTADFGKCSEAPSRSPDKASVESPPLRGGMMDEVEAFSLGDGQQSNAPSSPRKAAHPPSFGRSTSDDGMRRIVVGGASSRNDTQPKGGASGRSGKADDVRVGEFDDH